MDLRLEEMKTLRPLQDAAQLNSTLHALAAVLADDIALETETYLCGAYGMCNR